MTFFKAGSSILALAGTLLLTQPVIAADMTTKDTLLDRVQIEDLMIEYYWNLTSPARHDLAKYWTEDAIFEVNGAVWQGRETIQKVYDTTHNERVTPGSTFNMLLNNPRIRVDGDTAVLDAIWTGVISDNIRSTPRLLEQGSEHAEFIKQDGRWLISKRVITSHGGMPNAWDGD